MRHHGFSHSSLYKVTSKQAPRNLLIEYLWKKTKKRATHNQYFKEFALLTVSVDKALAYFATHPETVLGLFGRYCEESGLELKQAA